MASAIDPGKLKQVFDKQVELAMQGDHKAAKFVFEQARALSEVKGGITLVQNINHYGNGPDPQKPTEAVPGSQEKLEVMRRRVGNGQSLASRHDREHVNLD
jgi:hypothetical protein